MKTFRIGGVHPAENKLSAGKAIETLALPKQAVFPLSQHIGAPATAIVKKGDVVKVGTKIAEAGGFVSAAIFSSVSGKVNKVDSVIDASGYRKPAIFIDVEGDEWEETIDRSKDLVKECNLTPEEIVAKIKNAGIVGMGGAGFPTHVKLSPKEPEKIDYIIANCAECEPYLTSDYRRMIEEPEKLIEGMRIILSLFDNAKGIFGIEDNKPDCIAKLTELTKNEPRMEVKALKTKYPQGSERQLIFATTGRAINSTMLPADAGCIVDNVDTIVAIYHAVKLGRPLMHRIVTITGDAIADPRNFYVCIGTNYAELVEAAGGFKTQPKKIISGGPMMGFAMFGLDVPTTKTTSALLCLTEDAVEDASQNATACINCGRCVEACPSRIVPSRLADFAENHLEEPFEQWHGMECVECGSCSFTCPAKRNLAQSIKSMRKTILANRRKK